jgi:hypothetical protein
VEMVRLLKPTMSRSEAWLLPKSHLGNGKGTVRSQVRTYDRAGIVATTIAAARLVRTRRHL